MKFLKNNKILEITEANPSDALAVLEYLKQVGSESDNLLIDSNGLDISVEVETKKLEAAKKSIINKYYIGKVDSQIVSIANINGVERDKVKHNVSVGLSVIKEYWNLGIATHMMNHILNYCRMTKEIENITLEVRSDNQYAIKIYKKLGFKEIGKFTNYFKIDEKHYDCLIMELIIKHK